MSTRRAHDVIVLGLGGMGSAAAYHLECHELWHDDDATRVQRVERLVALCPTCHEGRHPCRPDLGRVAP